MIQEQLQVADFKVLFIYELHHGHEHFVFFFIPYQRKAHLFMTNKNVQIPNLKKIFDEITDDDLYAEVYDCFDQEFTFESTVKPSIKQEMDRFLKKLSFTSTVPVLTVVKSNRSEKDFKTEFTFINNNSSTIHLERFSASSILKQIDWVKQASLQAMNTYLESYTVLEVRILERNVKGSRSNNSSVRDGIVL